MSKGRVAGGVAEIHVTHQWTEPTYSCPTSLSTTRHQVREQVREASTVEANISWNVSFILVVLKFVLLRIVFLCLRLWLAPLFEQVK